MRMLMLGFVFMALAIGQASAQKINLGLEAGANFSNYIGSGAGSGVNTKLGFAGGGFLCLNLGNSFALQPEILYEQKGIQGSSNKTVELDYIEIPILLKLSLGAPGFNPGILLGPAFSLNTLANGIDGKPITDISTLDVGLVGGVQVDINKFFFSGRYELGLNDIIPNSYARFGASTQNGTLTFLVGYSFM